MVLAILPPYKHYKKITFDAGLFVVRQISQLGDPAKTGKGTIILFDNFIPQTIANKFNKQAVMESLSHAKVDGQDITAYKGMSLVDLNFYEISQKIFFPIYREALCFISCINEFKPSIIYLEKGDEWTDLFEEIAKQLDIELRICDNFGPTDRDVTVLIKTSYSKTRDVNYHPSLKLSKLLFFFIAIYNFWSKIIHFFRGDKPFIFLDFYNPLNPIRAEMLFNKGYYALLSRPVKMNLKCLLLGGGKILPFKDKDTFNEEVKQIISNYCKLLDKINVDKLIGRIDYSKNHFFVTKTAVKMLAVVVPKSFKQLADNIDIFDSSISNNDFQGSLVPYDTPWKMRLIIRLCQKYSLPNAVMVNGYMMIDSYEFEAKTANLALCYGTKLRNSYFKDKTECLIVGNPLFAEAFKKRGRIKINFPPKKILVGLAAFSPIDINYHYSDSEKFLLEVLEVLKKIETASKFKFDIAVKLHPASIKNFYQWFLEKKDYNDIKIINGGVFQKIVSKFDLFITDHSTSIFETALMNIPVIFYHPSKQILFDSFNGEDDLLPIAHNVEELHNLISKMFRDYDYAHLFNDLNKLESFTSLRNGRVRQRIPDVINKHLILSTK